MQVQKDVLEKLLVDIYHLNERCDHRQAYQCSLEAVSLAGEPGVERPLRYRVALAAARCAYYLSLFDECLSHIDMVPDVDGTITDVKHSDPAGTLDIPAAAVIFEARVIRANVARRRGEFEDAISILDRVIEDDGNGISSRLITDRLLSKGSCLYLLGRHSEAREYLETALGLATHNDDIRARSRVLVMMGLVSRTMGFMDKALDYFKRAKDLCRQYNDNYAEAAAWLNEGVALYHLGRFDESEKAAVRARRLFGKVEWVLGVCRTLILQGNDKRKCGEYSGAIRCYGKAGEIAEANGFKRELALTLNLMGAISGSRGDLPAALKYLSRALGTISSVAPNGDVACDIRRRLGLVFLLQEKFTEAEKYFESALKDAVKADDKWSSGLILRARGSKEFRMGDRDKGKALFNDAIDHLRAGGCVHELARTHLIFANELYSLEGNGFMSPDPGNGPDVDKALHSLIEASHLFSGTDDDNNRKMTDLQLKKVLRYKRNSDLIKVDPTRDRDVLILEKSRDLFISEKLVAVSDSMVEVWKKVSFASSFSRPVLITGETGTGKELIARLIHDKSDRVHKPFVAVNCAAIPDHLFESEFFGHKKGCFTGALTDRKGFFEEADGGTIFLDEIGELTLIQQVKLLRVLQEKKIRKIGENMEKPVDFRVISATNRSVEEMVGLSEFRQDLYYRINIEHIHLPPLRTRPEDVVALLTWRVCGNGNGSSRRVRIEKLALERLQNYMWPGNVRELISVADRVNHMIDSELITADMLPEKIMGGPEVFPVGDSTTAKVGTEHSSLKEKLNRVMSICRGNKSAAAKWLGISRGTLYKELRRAGLGHYIK
ncbi:MAG: sigma 54-interacting transcriptional regulator [Candidatus Krumholzibacteria bacterium]|nr:sigma 54-interacting transcriptional regulator [Candidatus Krumholzibacteria bacterium]